jgi:tetratricopeptide (TPR) repeat protein
MTGKSPAAELRRRAESMMRQERWLDASKLLKSRSSLVHKNWELSWNLGWCYFKLARFNEAARHLRRATKLATENAACKWALGSVYLKREQYKKAEAILLESLRIKDTHSTRIALALAYLAQGKIIEAETIHLQGIRLKPKKSERYESYAAFLFDVGRDDDALQMQRRAEKLRRVN